MLEDIFAEDIKWICKIKPSSWSWCKLLIPAPRMRGQVDLCGFDASLVYVVNSKTWGLLRESFSQLSPPKKNKYGSSTSSFSLFLPRAPQIYMTTKSPLPQMRTCLWMKLWFQQVSGFKLLCCGGPWFPASERLLLCSPFLGKVLVKVVVLLTNISRLYEKLTVRGVDERRDTDILVFYPLCCKSEILSKIQSEKNCMKIGFTFTGQWILH